MEYVQWEPTHVATLLPEVVSMAAKKSSRAKAVAKKPAKKTAAKKAAPSRKMSRKAPETLRLTSFTPGFTVNDIEKSLAFYTEGLGFIVGERWTKGDVLLGVMLKAGSSELGLTQDDWKKGKDRKKGVGFSIWCDTNQDVDVIAARVKAAGFSLTEEPTSNAEWGVRSFSVDDPDGFHISISRKLSR